MPTPVTVNEYDEEIIYDAQGRPIYQGWAKPISQTGGTALPIWKIQKVFYDSTGRPIKRRFADGNTKEDKIFDDRASYTFFN